MPWRVLGLVGHKRDRAAHSGDNIAVDTTLFETDPPTGTLLAARTAILRVSEVPNDGCVKRKVRCDRDAQKWITPHERLRMRLRGLHAEIEQDGEVRIGDTLRHT